MQLGFVYLVLRRCWRRCGLFFPPLRTVSKFYCAALLLVKTVMGQGFRTGVLWPSELGDVSHGCVGLQGTDFT